MALVHLGLRHVSSHDGRHWWIDDAIKNGVDVKTFTEAGGWKSPVVPLQMYASKAKIANQGMRGTSLAVDEEEHDGEKFIRPPRRTNNSARSGREQ